jgi:hypothetical protein
MVSNIPPAHPHSPVWRSPRRGVLRQPHTANEGQRDDKDGASWQQRRPPVPLDSRTEGHAICGRVQPPSRRQRVHSCRADTPAL